MEQKKNYIGEIRTFRLRKEEALVNLVPLAKAAARILKDVGHPSTALDIEAQLAVLDSIDDDLKRMCAAEPDEVAKQIMAGLERELGRM